MPGIEIYFSYSFMQTCILPFILYLLFFLKKIIILLYSCKIIHNRAIDKENVKY